MGLAEIIVSVILLLFTGCSVIIWWFTTYTIKSINEDIDTLQMELESWRNTSIMEHNNSSLGIARLDTLVEERLSDVKEIKEALADLQKRFVCKDDLRNAFDELKTIILNNLN